MTDADARLRRRTQIAVTMPRNSTTLLYVWETRWCRDLRP